MDWFSDFSLLKSCSHKARLVTYEIQSKMIATNTNTGAHANAIIEYK